MNDEYTTRTAVSTTVLAYEDDLGDRVGGTKAY